MEEGRRKSTRPYLTTREKIKSLLEQNGYHAEEYMHPSMPNRKAWVIKLDRSGDQLVRAELAKIGKDLKYPSAKHLKQLERTPEWRAALEKEEKIKAAKLSPIVVASKLFPERVARDAVGNCYIRCFCEEEDEEDNEKANIELSSESFYCRRCGDCGTSIRLVMAMLGADSTEAAHIICKAFGINRKNGKE